MLKQLIFLLLLSFSHSSLSSQAIEGTLLGTWSDSTLVGSNSFNNIYNEIWGVVAQGKEYAVLGSTFGTHFFDLTDPTQPELVATIEGGTTGGQIIHRDFHDLNGYLYGVSDEGGQSTLQIMDLSFLPDSVPVIYDSAEFIRRSHNIFIDSSAQIMYSCISNGQNVSFTPLRTFDISDPSQPTIIRDYSSIDGFNFSQVHDAFVRNDTAYLNCGPSGFVMADFSDPLVPVALATLSPDDYLQSGYNHSGWLSDDGKTYVMADEDWDHDLKVFDMTSLPEMILIDTIDAGSDNPFTIPHNQIILGDYLYSSYYYDGLQVWDISDLQNIERVLHYPTSKLPHRNSYEGSWGVYPFLPSGLILVSDMQEGLFVLQGVEQTLSSTEEVSEIDEKWTIFPNPNSGSFLIKTDSELKIDRMDLYSIDGKYLSALTEDNELSLPKGQYVVKLFCKGKHSSKTLIIAY